MTDPTPAAPVVVNIRALTAVAVTVLAATLFILSHTRLKVWQSDVALWSRTAVQSPDKPRPIYNFCIAAMRYNRQDRPDPACIDLVATVASRRRDLEGGEIWLRIVAPHPETFIFTGER